MVAVGIKKAKEIKICIIKERRKFEETLNETMLMKLCKMKLYNEIIQKQNAKYESTQW